MSHNSNHISFLQLRRTLFSFIYISILNAVSINLTPGNFAYTCQMQIKVVGIVAIKFEGTFYVDHRVDQKNVGISSLKIYRRTF